MLIGCDWYGLTAWNLGAKGQCVTCGTACARRKFPADGAGAVCPSGARSSQQGVIRPALMSTEYFQAQRHEMLATIRAHTSHLSALIGKPALDERVLTAMGKVPRHEFVPIEVRPYAYANGPLPIGLGKTISQPFVVAVMTDLLDVRPDDAVLEVGTGLGYQAAVLAELTREVYSIELNEELAERAKRRLHGQGYTSIELKIGNGYYGWPEHAPFDRIIVTAAPDLIPPPLIYQLKAGGRMVIPVGLPDAQQLVLAEKDQNGRVTMKATLSVRFSVLEESDQPPSRVS
jgi:protein-L-isoaspartate(D-aspartate) O-methyltransferase